MRAIRRLSLLALLVAFAQVVFGAIVRITGSGLGCGNHWPDCYGSFTPGTGGSTLLVEISHRYGAATLSLLIVILAALAWSRKNEAGVGGNGGVLRGALTALALVVVAALFGAVTVKMELNPLVVATHLGIAMALLAVLVFTAVRAGAFAVNRVTSRSTRTVAAARAAMGITFVTLIFGALTANTPGAPISCQGFPWCRAIGDTGLPLWVQVTHRILALLLLGHLIGVAIGVRKRAEPGPVRIAAWTSLGVVVLQILVAAAMVEMQLPPAFRSLHQAVGTLLWIVVSGLAAIAHGPPTASITDIARESPSRGEFATPEGVST